ncbi:MAG: hypothetical protein Q9159_005716 [Coniocarpon cinnabarinum]
MGWVDQVPGAGNLFIGGLYALRRRESIKQTGITHVVSVLRWPLEEELVRPYKHLQIDVDDEDEENLLEHFAATNRFIEDALQAGGSVLVHCAMGKSRSATIVVAYLMNKYRMAPFEALRHLQEARGVCEPNEGFMQQLHAYYAMGAPADVEGNASYHRWLYKRELQASRAIKQAPDADKILFADEQKSGNAAKGLSLRCKKCRQPLATSEFLVQHKPREKPDDPSSMPVPPTACSHYFVEPLRWMKTELDQGKLEGRLECPKCKNNIGKYAWQGMQCSCGDWVAPGVSLAKSRIDEAQLSSVKNPSSLGIRLPPGSPSTDNPTATVRGGVVAGTTTLLPSASAPVNKFLGVPYATAPRFGLPVEALPWKDTLDATAFRPGCLQAFPNPPAIQKFNQDVYVQPPEPSEEDCFYANVYAPSTPSRSPGGYSVLLYIFGGDFNFGNAGQPLYDGSAFASYQDVIVVTFNWRNSVFGFPNSPAIPVENQNLGLLDQRFMMQWMQDNIQAFGGDPAKVTVWGESSGSQSVDGHLVAYNNSNAPFRAAILQAGQSTYVAAKNGKSNSGDSFTKLAAALACTGNDTAQLQCVMDCNSTAIINAIQESQVSFSPVVDGVTYFEKPAGRRVSGDLAQVPVMGGTNAKDGEVFVFSGFGNVTNIEQVGQVTGAILQGFNSTAAPQVALELTGNLTAMDATSSPFDLAAMSYTLVYVQCLLALWGTNSAVGGAETFRYYYAADGFPNEAIFPNAGSYHSAEIRQIWQTYAGGPVNPVTPAPLGLQPSNVQPTPNQEAVSRTMNAAWARFAKNPYLGPGWPPYLPHAPDQMLGVFGTRGEISLMNARKVDALCNAVDPLYKAILGSDYPGLSGDFGA